MKPLRVVIVEDAPTVRVLLRGVLEADPRFEVAGEFERAESALTAVEKAPPDVVLMDVLLPGIDGLEAVRRIMWSRPIPILVVSGASRVADTTLAVAALSAGALAVVEKPRLDRTDPQALERFGRKLRRQIVALSGVKLVRQRGMGRGDRSENAAAAGRSAPPAPRRGRALLGLVASTGGPAALQRVLTDLGPNFPLPIAVVQHISGSFAAGFARWLAGVVPFPVEVASERGTQMVAGVVTVAPPDRHLRLTGQGVEAWQGPVESWQRPSGNVLLGSMADHLGAHAIGVVLTGMGADGARGLLALRRAGALTIAEDASSAVIDGMPGTARACGAVCESWPLARIGPRLRAVALASDGDRIIAAGGAS